MKNTVIWITAALLLIPAMLAAFTMPSALSAEPTQKVANKETAVGKQGTAASSEYTLTVLNPQGAVKKDRDLAPRLDTLEGKNVAMWLSATADQLYAGKGAELYDLLEKMLKEKFSGIQIVRYADLPMKFMPEKEVVDAIVKTQPDAVVAGFGG
jgi:hypothetical protein